MVSTSTFAKRVEGRQEGAQLNKLLEMREGFRSDLTDLRAALQDLRGIDSDKDKAIDNFDARIDAMLSIIDGKNEIANKEMQSNLHGILEEAAKLAREESPSDAFSYLNRYNFGNKVVASSDVGGSESTNSFFEAQDALMDLQGRIETLTKKMRQASSKYRVVGAAGKILYSSNIDGIFEDIEMLGAPRGGAAYEHYVKDLLIDIELARASKEAKDVAGSARGPGPVFKFLNDYQGRFEQAPPHGTDEKKPRTRGRKHAGEHITIGYTATLNSYAEQNGYKKELAKEYPDLASRLDEAAKARMALSDKDAIELYKFLALAWRNGITPYLKDSDFATFLKDPILMEITNMNEVSQINVLAKKLTVIYGTLFTDEQLEEMGMKERHHKKLRMTVGDMNVTENFWDNNTTWYDIYKIFDKAWRSGVAGAAANSRVITTPPPPPVFSSI